MKSGKIMLVTLAALFCVFLSGTDNSDAGNSRDRRARKHAYTPEKILIEQPQG